MAGSLQVSKWLVEAKNSEPGNRNPVGLRRKLGVLGIKDRIENSVCETRQKVGGRGSACGTCMRTQARRLGIMHSTILAARYA